MSSLSSAMSAALSGLNSQSSMIANISTNLSNIGTTAYKKSNLHFASLVSGRSGSPYSTGSIGNGVRAMLSPNMNVQGNITGSTRTTHMAIDGRGFFVTANNSSGKNVSFTRDGTFSPNDSGFLVNANGQYLMGLPTDKFGNVNGSMGSVGSLKPIDLRNIGGAAKATAKVGITATVPAQAKTGDKFTRDIEVFDSLGTAHILKSTWEKTGANKWKLTFDNPVLASDISKTTGTAAGSVDLTFDSKGKLTGMVPNPPKVKVTGWTTGAANSDIALNLDNIGQFSTDGPKPALVVKRVEQDGTKFGSLKSVTVKDKGFVVATFNNGQTRPVFKVPIATFTNPSGLKASGNNGFLETLNSGSYTLHSAGNGGSGKVRGGELERSNVATAEQMTKLISAQQAYSASAEIISTTNKLHDTIMRAKR